MTSATALPAATGRAQTAWCYYDWANSVYSLVITTTVFPIYFAALGKAAGGVITVFGQALRSETAFSYTLSAAFLFVALLNPVLSGIADASGRRMFFLKAFCYLGAASCAGLFFFTEGGFDVGLSAFFLATVGFCGSLVFYNAYLPGLAAPAERDRLSARGFAYGYVGSVLLQILVLLPILMPGWFGGITSGLASRLAFVGVGLWWAGFAQIPFARLPQDAPVHGGLGEAIRHGLATTAATWRRVRAQRRMLVYLCAYFFFNMGVQTIMYLATLFGTIELGLPQGALIGTILALQLVAIPGAMGTARAAGRFGEVPVIRALLVVWIGVCVGAYFTHTATQFYALAVVVGLMMGGTQSLCRSTWANLIPADEEAHATAYFAFQDLADKLSIVGGTFVYGLIAHLTGSMRVSSLALAGFFVVGLVGLGGMKARRGAGSPLQ